MIRFLGFAWLGLLAVPLVGHAGEKPVVLHARVTSHVAKIYVKQGELVKAGELLFELDDRPFAATFAQASAKLQQADAELKLAKVLLDRANQLFRDRTISNVEYETTKLQHTKALANQIVALTDRNSAKAVLDSTKILAPVHGRIVEIDVAVGSVVKANETRLALVQPAKVVEVEVKLPPNPLRELLKERHAELLQVLELRTMQFQNGRLGYEEVSLAQRAVLEAALELAETHAERLTVLRKNIDLTEQLYKYTEARYKAGALSRADVHQARALVLETRIRLLREEAKSK